MPGITVQQLTQALLSQVSFQSYMHDSGSGWGVRERQKKKKKGARQCKWRPQPYSVYKLILLFLGQMERKKSRDFKKLKKSNPIQHFMSFCSQNQFKTIKRATIKMVRSSSKTAFLHEECEHKVPWTAMFSLFLYLYIRKIALQEIQPTDYEPLKICAKQNRW